MAIGRTPSPRDPWPDPAPEHCDEWYRVRLWRWKAARHAGLSFVEADLFADSPWLDVSELRRLKAKGCPDELLARILL